MNSTRKRILLAVNLALLIAILIWLQGHISFSELTSHFEAMPIQGPAVALALNLAVLGVYGARLAQLVGSRQGPASAVVVMGFGMNGVVPFRLGEVAKLAYARQRFCIATSRLVAATAAEKLLDLCALLVVGLLTSQLVVAPYLTSGLTVVGIVIAVAIAGCLLVSALLRHWERTGRQTHTWITDAVDTLRAQHNVLRILRLVSFTLTIWVATIASVYWMFHSVLAQFSLADATALTLVLALAIAIPSAPAGLGVVETGIVAYLHQALQIEANQALAIALAFHAIVVVPQVLATAAILLESSLRSHRAA